MVEYHVQFYVNMRGLLNNMDVSHRDGLSKSKNISKVQISQQSLRQRLESLIQRLFGFWSFIDAEKDSNANLILYLLSLSFFVKVIIWRDSIAQLRIWPEVIGFLLFTVIIYLKAEISSHYQQIDQDQPEHYQKKVIVRRGGRQIQISDTQLIPGDVFIAKNYQKINFDGIVIESKKLVVSETYTVTKKDQCSKSSFWGESDDNKFGSCDPFIMARSKVVQGTADILVCLVRQNCSFRQNLQKQSKLYEQTQIVTNTKNIIEKIEKGVKKVVYILIVYLVLKYIISALKEGSLTWFNFVVILQIIYSMIGISFLIQRLKIVRSLRFFIQHHSIQDHYRVRKFQTLQRINNIDMLILDQSTISKSTKDCRNSQEGNQGQVQIHNLPILNRLNKLYNLKIVCSNKKRKCKNDYGRQMDDSQFYEYSERVSQEINLQKLIKATFITNCSVKQFINHILPKYSNLNYKIAYVSNSQNEQNCNVPDDILHICFNKVGAIDKCSQKAWVKLQNKQLMEDILIELLQKSYLLSKLYNVYITLFANNVSIVIILLGMSITKFIPTILIAFSIIIVNLIKFRICYRSIVEESEVCLFEKRSVFRVLKFNLFLIIYYVFSISNLSSDRNIFLFLVSNSLFRTQYLIYKMKRQESTKNILCTIIGIIIVNLVNAFIYSTTEQINNLIFILGLPLLYSLSQFTL